MQYSDAISEKISKKSKFQNLINGSGNDRYERLLVNGNTANKSINDVHLNGILKNLQNFIEYFDEFFTPY